jgi:hypothetical protein
MERDLLIRRVVVEEEVERGRRFFADLQARQLRTHALIEAHGQAAFDTPEYRHQFDEERRIYAAGTYLPEPRAEGRVRPSGLDPAQAAAIWAVWREGDELWMWSTDAESWQHLCGRGGYVLVRDGAVNVWQCCSVEN